MNPIKPGMSALRYIKVDQRLSRKGSLRALSGILNISNMIYEEKCIHN